MKIIVNCSPYQAPTAQDDIFKLLVLYVRHSKTQRYSVCNETQKSSLRSSHSEAWISECWIFLLATCLKQFIYYYKSVSHFSTRPIVCSPVQSSLPWGLGLGYSTFVWIHCLFTAEICATNICTVKTMGGNLSKNAEQSPARDRKEEVQYSSPALISSYL